MFTSFAAAKKRALDVADIAIHGLRELLQHVHRRSALGPTCFPSLNVRDRDVNQIRQLTWRAASHDPHPAKAVIIPVRG